ncbi:MAG TPA: hypothetical protein VGK76_01785 [Candidatus Eisenbacteria bacterium]
MFIGHYGVSFATKSGDRSIPLWVLFIAVQLLDVAWAPFVLLGIEKVRIVPGFTATNPLDLYYMPFTHSLVAALLWSAAAFAVYRLVAPGKRASSALLVGAAVFSHWVLDLLVHRPDLPLYDNTAKVGLGLWNFPALALGLEAVLLFGGMWLYFRSGAVRRTAIVVFGLIMLGVQVYVFFGPPPPSGKAAAVMALVAYAVFALVIRMLERPPRLRQATAISALLVTACVVAGCAAGTGLHPAIDAPTHFLVRGPDGRAVEPTPGAGCHTPMIDPRDGAPLILIRSAGGQGDYQVPVARYGVRKGELLRLDCATGNVIGIIRR